MRALVAAFAVLLLALTPAAAAAPEQVHLGFPTSSPQTTLAVNWLDVQADPDPHVTVTFPDGEERRYDATLTDGPAAGNVYEAVLSNLPPATAFTYRIGDREFAAATPPADAPTGDEAFTFVALGDMGVTPQASATVAAVLDLAPDFVMHAGDLSYAHSDPVTWKRWFDLIEPVAAETPWIPALGNHETYTVVPATTQPSAIEIGYFQQRFSLPGNELWYAFDYRGVHVVAVDSWSTVTAPDAPQLTWLQEDLLSRNAQEAAWRVVFLHEPLYSSNSHGSATDLQDAFDAILETAKVDLVVTAHDHGYERSFPLVGGVPVTTDKDVYPAGLGVVHVVTGGGGQSLYSDWEQPAPAWSAERESLYHVTEFTVTADTLSVRVVPTAGDAFTDEWRIERAATVLEDSVSTPKLVPGAELVAVLGVVVAVALRWRRLP